MENGPYGLMEGAPQPSSFTQSTSSMWSDMLRPKTKSSFFGRGLGEVVLVIVNFLL